MFNLRKNLIIIIFLLSSIFVVLLFLNLNASWRKQEARILNPGKETAANLPKKISRGKMKFFELKNVSGRIVFYEENDSIVYESGPDGRDKRELVRIPGALKIVFSPSGNGLIAAISEKGVLKNYYFDLEDNKRKEMPKNAENIVFSPDGEQIVYYFRDKETDEAGIFTAGPDGSKAMNIFKTRINQLRLLWVKPDLIFLYSEADRRSTIFSMTANGKDFQKVSEEEFNRYHKNDSEEISILRELGIETVDSKLSPLKDYLIFIDAADGKLYSLKL